MRWQCLHIGNSAHLIDLLAYNSALGAVTVFQSYMSRVYYSTIVTQLPLLVQAFSRARAVLSSDMYQVLRCNAAAA
jgi:hypothetical protein